MDGGFNAQGTIEQIRFLLAGPLQAKPAAGQVFDEHRFGLGGRLVFDDEFGAERVECGGVFTGYDEFFGGEAVFERVDLAIRRPAAVWGPEERVPLVPPGSPLPEIEEPQNETNPRPESDTPLPPAPPRTPAAPNSSMAVAPR